MLFGVNCFREFIILYMYDLVQNYYKDMKIIISIQWLLENLNILYKQSLLSYL